MVAALARVCWFVVFTPLFLFWGSVGTFFGLVMFIVCGDDKMHSFMDWSFDRATENRLVLWLERVGKMGQ